MGRISLEPYDEAKHRNHMPELCRNIVPNGQVIVIEEGRFRLEFLSMEQLRAAIRHFEKKDGGSTRAEASGGDHWEFQSWQSRLPAGINNKHNRYKILSVLTHALEQYGKQMPIAQRAPNSWLQSTRKSGAVISVLLLPRCAAFAVG